jgi:hypothetical protein
VATFSCRDSRTVASAGGTRQGALSGHGVIARASTSFFAHPSDNRLRPTTLNGSSSGLGSEACSAEFGSLSTETFCGAKCEFYQHIAIQRLRTAPRHHPVSWMKSSLSLNPRQATSLAAMAISSNPLHQEVRGSGGGFPGSKIRRHVRPLASPGSVCGVYLARLSASSMECRSESLVAKFRFPSARVRPSQATSVRHRDGGADPELRLASRE